MGKGVGLTIGIQLSHLVSDGFWVALFALLRADQLAAVIGCIGFESK